MKDSNQKIGDQLAMKFITVFGEDKNRIRRRKKLIRYLFRFLGRQDLCERYLTMSSSRDPEEIREVTELTLLDFPSRLEKDISLVGERLDSGYATALRFKLVTQMRTGGKDRELVGLRSVSLKDHGSSLRMRISSEVRLKISVVKDGFLNGYLAK